ncbi:MAG: glycosyltransferase, partial [Promicromonosporaceae bacterium]|nr:glycosyltransferase [Promicromonosporaceae bacterium]
LARYLQAIYATRLDLRLAFQSVPGRETPALIAWAREHGVGEALYDANLLLAACDATAAALPPAPQDDAGATRPLGVNLIGFLGGEMGLGASARLLDKALVAAGVPTSTYPVIRDNASRQRADFRDAGRARYDVSLVAVNADQTPGVVGEMWPLLADSYRIGYWYWEVESFPADRDFAFTQVHEVWAATDFVRDALAQRGDLQGVPVRTVAPPLPQRPAGPVPPLPARFGIPAGRPWFFFAFDYFSVAERKNPLGLIAAFIRAFPAPADDGPLLVIKTINADHRLADAERVRAAAAARPDLLLIEDYLDQDELLALTANCTAYVSLHRAEGLGLTIADAMAWGRPVIVSDYSGSRQFCTVDNALLVPCGRVPIPEGIEPYPAGTPWGDPDLDAAAAAMRLVIERPELAATLGARAARDIVERHSPAAAGAAIMVALAAARQLRADLPARENQEKRRLLPGRLPGRLLRRWRGAR